MGMEYKLFNHTVNVTKRTLVEKKSPKFLKIGSILKVSIAIGGRGFILPRTVREEDGRLSGEKEESTGPYLIIASLCGSMLLIVKEPESRGMSSKASDIYIYYRLTPPPRRSAPTAISSIYPGSGVVKYIIFGTCLWIVLKEYRSYVKANMNIICPQVFMCHQDLILIWSRLSSIKRNLKT